MIRGSETTLDTAFADLQTIHQELGYALQRLGDTASFSPFDEAVLLGNLADVESWGHSVLGCASFIRARVAGKYIDRLRAAAKDTP